MSKHTTDNDDWFPTAKERKQFRSIAKVDPELLTAYREGALKRGRPKLANKKQSISLRLDPEIIAAFKAKGKGWQSEINAALRAAIRDEN